MVNAFAQLTGDLRSKQNGNWNDFNTWQRYNGTIWVDATVGEIPNASTNVTISTGNLVDLNISVMLANNIDINGILQFVNAEYNLTISGNLNVNSTGVFRTSTPLAASYDQTISLYGNLLVDGQLDGYNTNLGFEARLFFNFLGSTNTSISGNGSLCEIYEISVDKGTDQTFAVEALRVITLIDAVSSNQRKINLLNGTFKISSPSALTPYYGNQTVCNQTARLWLNNAGASISWANAGNAIFDGNLLIDNGTLNIGGTMQIETLSPGNSQINNGTIHCARMIELASTFTVAGGTVTADSSLTLNSNGTSEQGHLIVLGGIINIGNGNDILRVYDHGNLEISGGNINVFGRVQFDNGITPNNSTFTMNAGNLNVDPQYTTNLQNVDVVSFQDNTVVNFTGGKLNIVDPERTKDGSNDCEFKIWGTTGLKNFVGSTVQFGNGVSNSSQTTISGTRGFRLSMPAGVNLGDVIILNPASYDRNLTLSSTTSSTTNLNNLTISNLADTININGNILNISGNIINNGILNGTAANSHLRFTGSAAQSYSGTGNIVSNLLNLTFNNSSTTGVTLNAPLGATTINLTDGNVYTDATNLLTVYGTSPANLTGGSASNYVQGPLRRAIPNNATNSQYQFPVGKTNFRMIELFGLNSGGTGSGFITNEVFEGIPMNGNTGGTGIVDPTVAESIYWKLTTNLAAVSLTNISSIRVTYADPATNPPRTIAQSNNSLTGTYNSIGRIPGTGTLQSESFNLTGINPSGDAYFIISEVKPFSGTYTVGTTGNYLNLTAVANELRTKFMNGNVYFELQADYNPATESIPVIFDKLMLSQPQYGVIIRPKSGVASTILSRDGNIDNEALIILDNVQNLTFDGRAGGAGSSIWTITNTRATNPGPVFELRNGARTDTLSYLNLKSNNQSLTGGVLVIGATNKFIGNNNNVIRYCDITGNAGNPRCGIYSLGMAGYENTANKVDQCTIYDFFSTTEDTKGIFIGNNNTGWTVSNNKLYQTGSRTFAETQFYIPIHVDAPSGTGFTISGNTIGFANSSGTGTTTISGAASQFAGIWANVGSGTASTIQNNTISNIGFTSTYTGSLQCGVFSGIFVENGSVNIGSSGNSNIVGSTAAVDNILIQQGNAGNSYGIKTLGTGTININYNQICGISAFSATAADDIALLGIYVDAVNASISNNIIGSSSLANSLKAGTIGFTTGSTSIYGISSTASGIVDISNNIVANHIAYGSGASGVSSGIYSDDGRNTINNNQIYKLASYTTRAGTQENSTICGIRKTSTDANQVISRNIIHSLSCEHLSTAADVTISGITLSSNSGTADVVSRNFIHSFDSQINDAIYTGIYLRSGSANIQNNMIRLGIGKGGASITQRISIVGIYNNSSSTSSYLFNSVFIGGTGVDPLLGKNTSAFTSAVEQSSIISDNLFINSRSNSSGTVSKHYALYLQYKNLAVSDYNIFRANGNGGILSHIDGNDYSGLQAHRAYFQGQDLHSGIGDPNFNNATGDASSVNLHLTGNTPAYRTGIITGGVSDDYDGIARTSNIGADGGNYAITNAEDIFTPNFSYIPILHETTLFSITIDVRITDQGPSGQGVSQVNPPRMYCRRSNLPQTWGAAIFKTGTLISGDGNDGIWRFALTAGMPGDDYPVLFNNEIIEYFFVAQDLAIATPNVWYSKFDGTSPVYTNVSTSVTLPSPTVPVDFFGIDGNLHGSYTVGTGQTFPTLTGARGLFQNLNALDVTGNITAIITDHISEPATYGCGQWTESGSGGYIVTISTNTTTVKNITTTATADMIRLTGVDRLIFDGGINGVRYITFTQDNANYSTFTFSNDANNNIIKNCYIAGRPISANRGIISIGSGSTTGNSGNEISNNLIWNVSGMPQNSIYSRGNGSAPNSNNRILNNDIKNFAENGIWVSNAGNGNGWTISNNTLYNDFGTKPSDQQVGIRVESSPATGYTISGNSIGGKTPSPPYTSWENTGQQDFYGIFIMAGSTDTSYVLNNTIHDIWKSNTNVGTNEFRGIWVENNGLVNVKGNTFNNIKNDGSDLTTLIYMDGYANVKVSDNTISNITTTGNDDFRGIYADVTFASNTAAISNNSIKGININNTGVGVDFYGIYINRGNFDITGNTFGGINSSDKITFAGGGIMQMLTITGSDFNRSLRNNQISNIQSISNSGFIGYYLQNLASGQNTIQNNTIDDLNLNTSGDVTAFYLATGQTNMLNNTIGTATLGIQNSGLGNFYGIRLSASLSNNSLSGNSISNIQMPNTSSNFKGIWVSAGSSTISTSTIGSTLTANSIQVAGQNVIGISVTNSGQLTASNNIIANLNQTSILNSASIKGIEIDGNEKCTASGNSIFSINTASTLSTMSNGLMASQGIWFNGDSARTITGNIIYNISATAGANVTGIAESGTNAIISKNKIYNISNSATNGTASGIVLYELNSTSYVANNMISLGGNDATEYSGIWIPNTNSSVKHLYFNSIYIGGTASAGNSYAFLRGNNTTPIYMRDNILSNSRTGGTGKHYAIVSQNFSDRTVVNLENNNYYSANPATLGLWNGADNDFNAWIGNSGEISSINQLPNFIDIANGNLHLDPSNSCAFNGIGVVITGITDDFDGNIRPINPDLGADEIIPTGGNIVDNWTGRIDSVWVNPLNWQCELLPTSSSNITIGNVTNDPVINSAVTINALTIKNNGNLKVWTNLLTVNGVLTNETGGSLIINGGAKLTTNANFNNGGEFRLRSPNNHGQSGSYLDFAGTYSNTGSGMFYAERFFGQRQYHYFAPPIQCVLQDAGSNAKASLMQTSASGQFNANLLDYTESANINPNPTSMNDLVAAWHYVRPYSGSPEFNFVKGAGYAFYDQSDKLVTFQGKPNTGTQNVTLSFTNDDDGTTYNGWNLIANPYPSSIDWNSIAGTLGANLTNADNAIYVWEGDNLTGAYASYVNGSSSGTGNLTRYIAPMQAFFIHAKASPASFPLNNSHRLHSNVNFLKSTKASGNLVKLKVTKDSLSTVTVINFEDLATNEFDGQFDAFQMFGLYSKCPQLYSITETNKSTLSVNSLPLNNLLNTSVPLGIRSVDGGKSIIELNNVEGLDQTHVILEDKDLNKLINLRAQSKYEFDLAADFVANRFVLHFTENNPPVLQNPFSNLVTDQEAVFSYSYSDNVFIDNDLGDSIRYSAFLENGQILPSWLTFNPESKTFSGTPHNQDVGTLNIQLKATDILGASSTFNFVLDVLNVDDPPTLQIPIANINTLEDQSFEYSINNQTFKDVDLNDNLSYSVTLSNGQALPDWLKFNSETLKFAGTPSNDNVGTIEIKVIATDGSGESAFDIFTLQVINVNDAPIVQQKINDQDIMINTDYSFEIPVQTFIDIDQNEELKLTAILVNGSPLPTWLNFNPDMGIFSGMPLQMGEISINLKATDLVGASVSQQFKLTVHSTTDIEKIGEKIFSVFPNPTDGQFYLTMETNGVSSNWDINIKDINGRNVFQAKLNSSKQEFDLTGLAAGKYIIELKSGENKIIKSLIIK